MKYDLDLLRNFLLRIEDADDFLSVYHFLDLCPDPKKVFFHLSLLADAGFIDYIDTSTKDGDDMLVKRITFAGCEYLELIRSDSMWEKTKAKLTEIGGALSLTVVQEVVASIIRMGS